VEIGSKAKRDSLQLGDKVAVFPIYSCNSCQTCEQGLINSCSKFGCYGVLRVHLRTSSSRLTRLGVTGRGGGLSDFICVEDRKVYKLSENISLEIGGKSNGPFDVLFCH
jgi:(R,R)-butanediol dehydrogenase/meso-butanediol dehydrogenase/diacetyl reductase